MRTPPPVIVFGDHTRSFKYIDFPFAMGADGVKVLSARDGFNPKYLYHYLRSCKLPSAGYSRHYKFLKELAVPKPDLSEQDRVAAILDQADAIRAKRRRVLDHLDSLNQAIFHDMFGDPITNEKRLPRVHISDIAKVLTGNSPSRAKPEYFGAEIEWIKSDNLGDAIVTRAEEFLSTKGRAVARIAPSGSILVTCIAGSPTSIGKSAMADRDVAFNQQINAILPTTDAQMMFLLGQLKASPQLVRAKSSGGMKGLVNKSAFESIEVLMPSAELQRAYADRATLIHTQSVMVRRALEADDELFASLQSRAFRGEL